MPTRDPQPPPPTAAELTAGTGVTPRAFSPANIHSMIDTHGGGGGGATDHGALTGLADDDHTQYLLADGTRALSGNMTVNALVTIDGRDISVDGAALDTAVSKLAGIESGATADQTGAEIKAAYEAEANAFTDAQFTKLAGIETSATADQTGAEIKAAYEAEVSAFTDAQFTKLAGVETGATADQTGAEIKALYEAEASAFTDAQFTKLAGVETAATADQTGAEIKAAYEGEANTNAFTDTEQSKLSGIATGADVSPVASVNTKTGTVVLDPDDLSDAATTNKFTSAADISKLAGIETGAEVNTVDSVNGDTGTVVVPTPSNSIPFATAPTGVTFSCSSTDQLINTHGTITPADLSQYTQARIVVIRGGTTRAGLIVGVRYTTTSLSLTYGDYVALGASSTDVEISCPTANTAYASSWITLTAGALADITLGCYQRNVSVTGNAGFFRILLEVR